MNIYDTETENIQRFTRIFYLGNMEKFPLQR